MIDTVDVLIFVESRYKADRKRIKATISSLLGKQGIQSPVEVSVAIIGDRKMRELNKKYKGEEKTTDVLSFPLSEGEGTLMSNDVLRLGDIVISYPQVIKEAAEEEVMIDDKIDELVEHSLLHLLGVHHE